MTNYIYAPWTPEQEAQAIRWRKRGMTYAEVAQQMHVSKTTAEKRLKDICARNPGIFDKDTPTCASVAMPRRVINGTTTDLYMCPICPRLQGRAQWTTRRLRALVFNQERQMTKHIHAEYRAALALIEKHAEIWTPKEAA